MISVVDEAGLISGFKPAANAPIITHLQFADDTLLFCDAKEDQIKSVIAILRCYESAQALRLSDSIALILEFQWMVLSLIP